MIRLDCKYYINRFTGKIGILGFRGRDMFLQLEDGSKVEVEEGNDSWIANTDPTTLFNLCQILKDTPDDYELSSPVYGECYLKDVTNDKIIIEPTDSNGFRFRRILDRHGRLNDNVGCSCIIFPKGKDTWFGFKPDWNTKPDIKIFHAGQKVLVPYSFDPKSTSMKWTLAIYSHYDNDMKKHLLVGSRTVQEECILPFKGNQNLLGKVIN